MNILKIAQHEKHYVFNYQWANRNPRIMNAQFSRVLIEIEHWKSINYYFTEHHTAHLLAKHERMTTLSQEKDIT